jgi:predicted kinase
MRPTERPADEAATAAVYSEAVTRQVYERLAALAGTVLDAGCSVVVDASCTKRWQRDLLTGAARDRGASIIWVAFDLPVGELVARVTRRQARGDDPSDASAEIVMRQVAHFEPLSGKEVRGNDTLVRVTTADIDIRPESIAKRVVEMIG